MTMRVFAHSPGSPPDDIETIGWADDRAEACEIIAGHIRSGLRQEIASIMWPAFEADRRTSDVFGDVEWCGDQCLDAAENAGMLQSLLSDNDDLAEAVRLAGALTGAEVSEWGDSYDYPDDERAGSPRADCWYSFTYGLSFGVRQEGD